MAASRFSQVLFAIAVLFSSVNLLAAQSVGLAWDPNSENDLAGYLVYYGTASRNYDQTLSAATPSATVTNLNSGTTYYFAVTAYNTNGMESGYSNEVLYSTSGSPPPTPTPSPSGTPGQPDALLNISTRVQVRTGDSVLIGGFIVTGDGNKDVVIRALGPSLAGVGVPKILRNPELELYDSGGTLIDQNFDWTTLPPGTVPAEFQPSDPLEAAIVASLPAGAYTAVLRGEGGATGVALCELYDLSQDAASVRNISTRGEVGVDADVMIGGFIIGGTTPKKVIVRAIGPSLVAFGITGQLDNPEIELHDGTGSLVFGNDDWRRDQEQQVIDTGLPPSDDRESAIVATLQPGAYTAIVRGVDGAIGVALVEVYALDP